MEVGENMESDDKYKELKDHILALLRVCEPVDIYEFLGRFSMSYEVKSIFVDILLKIKELEEK